MYISAPRIKMSATASDRSEVSFHEGEHRRKQDVARRREGWSVKSFQYKGMDREPAVFGGYCIPGLTPHIHSHQRCSHRHLSFLYFSCIQPLNVNGFSGWRKCIHKANSLRKRSIKILRTVRLPLGNMFLISGVLLFFSFGWSWVTQNILGLDFLLCWCVS